MEKQTNDCTNCKTLLNHIINIRRVLVQIHNILGFVPVLEAMQYLEVTIEKINDIIKEHDNF